MASRYFPSLSNGFEYVALFYLFEIETPLSILTKIFEAPRQEVEKFKNSFSQESREPLILLIREKSDFEPVYYLRTKHEIISELYFDEKKFDKEQLISNVIQSFDENDQAEVQTLVNLFGNKRNIQQYSLDFGKLLDFCFSERIIKKVKRNSKLYETLCISKYWIYLYHENIDRAISYLEEILKEIPHNLHYRTELAKIYQHQNKYAEAEKILLDLLSLDKNSCYAMAELISVYTNKKEPDKCFEILDGFLRNTRIEKRREPQAIFNNIFKLCSQFRLSYKAKEYFDNYSSILDDRNKELYRKLFSV